jgi:WD40 repeat protein
MLVRDGRQPKSEKSEEPEEEPLLRYQRLGADVTEILRDDHATCLACHPKFLALGTRAGVVAVLDLNGNEIRRFSPHSAAVNDLCIDRSGEFVGSCSEDGTVAVSSLYDGEASTHWYHRPVCAIALDPEYPTRRVFATGGLTGQLVLNAKGWFGAKDSTLHAGEGPVRAIDIAPNGSLIAWANDLGVKVYDAQYNKRVSFVDRPSGSPAAEAFRCHLRWETETELLIGWADSIKIGRRAWHAHGMRTACAPHAHVHHACVLCMRCCVYALHACVCCSCPHVCRVTRSTPAGCARVR